MFFFFDCYSGPAPFLPDSRRCLTRSPAVWSSSKRSNKFLHMGRDCIVGNPPGTISAAFVLWAAQLLLNTTCNGFELSGT